MIVAGLIIVGMGGFWLGWRCKPRGLSDDQAHALTLAMREALKSEKE